MGQLASHPLTEKIIHYETYEHPRSGTEHGTHKQDAITGPRETQFFHCLGSMQGYRLSQEDSHLICNGALNSTGKTHAGGKGKNSTGDEFHKDALVLNFRNPLNFDRREPMELAVFAVFDGHGGDRISKALSYKLSDAIQKTLEQHRYTQTAFKTTQGLLAQLFKDAFLRLDRELFRTYQNSIQCGSTAIVTIIVNRKTVYCCNTGDSRALLSLKPTTATAAFKPSPTSSTPTAVAATSDAKNTNADHKGSKNNNNNNNNNNTHGKLLTKTISRTRQAHAKKETHKPQTTNNSHCNSVANNLSCVKNLSFDHKPLHIGELMRINDNGGTVSLGRVNGVLALSRAFGDFQFKRKTYNNHKHKHGIPQEEQVIVEPDVIVHEINYDRDEFVVLACDGIWDVYSNKRLVQFIRYHLALGLRFDEIVKKVLDHGIECADPDTGCGFDNYSIIIVALNKPGESAESWYERIKMRLLREKRIA